MPCPNSPDGNPESGQTLAEWKKAFKPSDQFCQNCGKAIW